MPFGEYIDLLEVGPTDLRIFLWNIFNAAPELRRDFKIPDIMDGFVDELPFMFFGGEGSFVGMHFDIDMSHVFLNQIHGRKRVILFTPDQSRNLYQMPFTVASFVDPRNPDYNRYPGQCRELRRAVATRRNLVHAFRLLAFHRIHRRRLFHQPALVWFGFAAHARPGQHRPPFCGRQRYESPDGTELEKGEGENGGEEKPAAGRRQ